MRFDWAVIVAAEELGADQAFRLYDWPVAIAAAATGPLRDAGPAGSGQARKEEFVYTNPSSPGDYLTLLAGYTYSIGVGHFFVRRVVASMRSTGPQEGQEERDYPLHSGVQGLMERFLYTTCWILGRAEFIPVWVAFKVAGGWKAWSKKPAYNVMLTGTGLSITFGVVGAELMRGIARENWQAIVIPAALIVASEGLRAWVLHQGVGVGSLARRAAGVPRSKKAATTA